MLSMEASAVLDADDDMMGDDDDEDEEDEGMNGAGAAAMDEAAEGKQYITNIKVSLAPVQHSTILFQSFSICYLVLGRKRRKRVRTRARLAPAWSLRRTCSTRSAARFASNPTPLSPTHTHKYLNPPLLRNSKRLSR